jgi:CRISPR-associated protein Csb1
MNYDKLAQIVTSAAALRRRQRLQPVGGKGDKIFPPTYPGEGRNNPPPRHVFERRRINGEEIWCVLVDSVQSQANRLEESLLAVMREGGVTIPHVVVDFSGKELAGVSAITSLDAPHRVYDAILRDSLLDGVPFMESEVGKGLAKASNTDASSVLEVSPTALLLGSWHSTGQGGGLGAKFARSLVSEIVAINAPVDKEINELRFKLSSDGDVITVNTPVDTRRNEIDNIRTAGRRTGSRIDPLGVLRKVEVYKSETGWDVTESGAGKKAKKARPSEINHGNIAPSVQALGITCDYLEHSFVLSFAGLRRLGFGSPKRNTAGRALLAALGLLALVEQDERGYALRSRCDLVCEDKAALEIVHPDGRTTETKLEIEEARALYVETYQAAQQAGFHFDTIRLTPQDKLVKIVYESQRLALEGEGGEEEASTTGGAQ